MITKLDPMHSKESDALKQTIQHLISGYNCFISVQDAFEHDSTASFWLEKARDEMVQSGNCGLGTTYAVAIDLMSEQVRLGDEMEEELSDENLFKLQSKISDLEKQNRILSRQLESIKSIINKEGD